MSGAWEPPRWWFGLNHINSVVPIRSGTLEGGIWFSLHLPPGSLPARGLSPVTWWGPDPGGPRGHGGALPLAQPL